MTNVTLANVVTLLDSIGLDGRISHVGQGWTRVYMAERPSGVQLGRVMFFNGEFRRVHWYRIPKGDISDGDRFWFDWEFAASKLPPMSDLDWRLLCLFSRQRAERDRQRWLQRRMITNIRRVSRGRKRKTGKIALPNQAKWAMAMVRGMIRSSGADNSNITTD